MGDKMKNAIKYIIPVVAIALIVLAILFFFKNCKGPGLGPGSGKETVKATESSESTDKKEKKTGESKDVTVEIKEDIVYINDKQFTEEEALKDYVESINNDGVKFIYKEDDEVILSTYEMVDKVFKDLGIDLYKTK